MSNDTRPEIRFPEFTDEWEQRKLGDESDVRDGTHDSPKYYDKGYPLVTSKNLKDFGLDLSNVSFISDEDFEVINKRSKVDIGDILFGMIGTIGNPVLVDRADFAIKNVALIKEQKKILNSFLIQILKSPVFDKYIKNENAGGTQKFLSLSKVRDFNFLCPNIDEQNCISAFFKKLDDTIALHQRKLDLLKETKKGFLQKMFPKNGAKVPEIRFPGFTEDWEERKLSEVANHRGGTAIEKYFKEDGKYKVISIGSYGLDSKYVDQNIRAVSNEVTDSRVVRNGELTMVLNDKTANGTIIGRSLLIEEDNKYVINQRNEIISPKENFDSNFAYTILNGPFRESVKRIVQGGTQIYVNYPAVSNLVLKLPDVEEQKKIGLFFKQLDDTIALHQRKLDLLKETKKGFLQKMFV